jgi:hypothetical protein
LADGVQVHSDVHRNFEVIQLDILFGGEDQTTYAMLAVDNIKGADLFGIDADRIGFWIEWDQLIGR